MYEVKSFNKVCGLSVKMMHGSFPTHFLLTLLIISFGGIFLISCSNSSDRKYFNGDIVFLEDDLQLENLTGEQVILDGVYAGRMDVCDSLIFMQHFIYPDYFISVFNHYTGKHLGDFIPKGNGPNEFVDISWIYQFFYEDGHLKGLLYSFSKKKIVIWNITESVQTGVTHASQISFPGNDSNIALGGYIFFENNKYIVANIKNFDSPDLPDQTYHRINYVTRETEATYSFYNNSIDNNDNVFQALYHHIPVAHNIKGTKLAAAMAILPQINLLDIETGKLIGLRMNRTSNFRNIKNLAREMKIHYLSITADMQYIYALYAGETTDLKSGFPNGRIIHLFDWNGKLLRKLYLDKEAGHIGIDVNDHALLIKNDQTDEIYRYYLNDKKTQ